MNEKLIGLAWDDKPDEALDSVIENLRDDHNLELVITSKPEDFLDKLNTPFDFFIVDISYENDNVDRPRQGIRLIQSIRHLNQEVPIIVLSTHAVRYANELYANEKNNRLAIFDKSTRYSWIAFNINRFIRKIGYKSSSNSTSRQSSKHERPKIFIGSSSEGYDLAKGVRFNLKDDYQCETWKDSPRLSVSILDKLYQKLEYFDYAIFIFHSDDRIEIRDKVYNITRDNVIFELGLFMGRLGTTRVFFAAPSKLSGDESFRILTDLSGVLYGVYDSETSDPIQAVADFCFEVDRTIKSNS